MGIIRVEVISSPKEWIHEWNFSLILAPNELTCSGKYLYESMDKKRRNEVVVCLFDIQIKPSFGSTYKFHGWISSGGSNSIFIWILFSLLAFNCCQNSKFRLCWYGSYREKWYRNVKAFRTLRLKWWINYWRKIDSLSLFFFDICITIEENFIDSNKFLYSSRRLNRLRLEVQ